MERFAPAIFEVNGLASGCRDANFTIMPYIVEGREMGGHARLLCKLLKPASEGSSGAPCKGVASRIPLYCRGAWGGPMHVFGDPYRKYKKFHLYMFYQQILKILIESESTLRSPYYMLKYI